MIRTPGELLIVAADVLQWTLHFMRHLGACRLRVSPAFRTGAGFWRSTALLPGVIRSESFRAVPCVYDFSIDRGRQPSLARPKKRAPSSHRRAWKITFVAAQRHRLSSTLAEVLGLVPGDSLNVKVL